MTSPSPVSASKLWQPVQEDLWIDTLLTIEFADRIIEQLSQWEKEGREYVGIRINCSGGEFDAGIKLYQRFKESSCSVIGFVHEKAWSAAFMALQGCTSRIAMRGSTLRIHNPAYVVRNAPITHDEDEEDYLKAHRLAFRKIQPHVREARETVIRILMERSNFTDQSKLEKLLADAKELSAEEALEMGFIDAIY